MKSGTNPAHVLARDELPRAAHRVHAKNESVVDRLFDRDVAGILQPKAQRPFRAVPILRLHRAEPPHEIVRLLEIVISDLLQQQSVQKGIDLVHTHPR